MESKEVFFSLLTAEDLKAENILFQDRGPGHATFFPRQEWVIGLWIWSHKTKNVERWVLDQGNYPKSDLLTPEKWVGGWWVGWWFSWRPCVDSLTILKTFPPYLARRKGFVKTEVNGSDVLPFQVMFQVSIKIYSVIFIEWRVIRNTRLSFNKDWREGQNQRSVFFPKNRAVWSGKVVELPKREICTMKNQQLKVRLQICPINFPK